MTPCHALLVLASISAPVMAQLPSLVADLHKEPYADNSGNPGTAVVFQNVAYFPAFATDTGFELYRSVGPGLNAQLFADVVAGAESSHPEHLTVHGSHLYFTVFLPTGRAGPSCGARPAHPPGPGSAWTCHRPHSTSWRGTASCTSAPRRSSPPRGRSSVRS